MNFHYIDLIIALTTLTLSLICILASAALRVLYKKRISLEALGWGILLVSLWNIASSYFRQIIFQDSRYINLILFFLILFLPLPFLVYMDQVQHGRYHKLYRILEIAILAELGIYVLLHFTGVRNLNRNTPLMLFLFALSLIFIMITILLDAIRKHIKKYLPSAIGMAILGIACFAKLIPFFLYGRMQQSNSFLPFGLIFLLFLAIGNTINELISMERGKQQALSASEAKGRFLANMSHEIRTPINAVLGMDEMILRECTEPQIKEYAMDIQNAGQSLLSLINDILDLSKIESGKLEILPEEYDFSSLIHDIMNMIGMKAKAKELEVKLSIDSSLPSRLWGDDIRLRQVLVNLMNNAVKYTEKGSVTLSVSGHVKDTDNISGSEKIKDRDDMYSSADAEADKNMGTVSLTFQVEDTGIGIKEEDLSKLFAEFERIEEDRNRNIEGTGLGMSITTQLLELMESKLQVESVYGKGSKFFFTLEQKIIDREPIGNLEERIRQQAKEYSYNTLFTAPEAQILVVDDNAVNRKVFISLLKDTQVNIDQAAGGYECLDMTKEKKYDIIFLDHMMPDLDGIETFHRLKAWKDAPNYSVPVVALTANAVTGAREMYLGEGFSSFLSKPINPVKLEKLLLQNLPEEKIQQPAPADINKKQEEKITDNDREPLSENSSEEEWPEIDGIDWEYAQMHINDRDILKTTINDFFHMMPTDAQNLENFFQMLQDAHSPDDMEEAFRQFRIKVHSMKSSAAMIGAVSLSGIARMLEYAARDQDPETIEAVTPSFLKEWQKMHELLSPLAKHKVTGRKGAADFPIVADCLPRLKDAMDTLDVDTADAIIAQLEEYQYPEPLVPVLEQLSLAVTNLDAEKTGEQIQIIQQYINKQRNGGQE